MSLNRQKKERGSGWLSSLRERITSLFTKDRIHTGLLVVGVLLLAYIAYSVSASPLPFSVGDKIRPCGEEDLRDRKVIAVHGDYICVEDGKRTVRWINATAISAWDVDKPESIWVTLGLANK